MTDCRHQRDSIFGRLLRSCRECEIEQHPEQADRAIRTWLRTEDVRRGALTVDQAVAETHAEYGR